MMQLLPKNAMKVVRLAALLVGGAFSTFLLHAQDTTQLVIATEGGDFSWTTGSRSTYTYYTGDIANYLTASIDGEGNFSFAAATLSTSTTDVCAPAIRRIQTNAIELVLNSTTANKIIIAGTSSGTASRTLRAIFVNGNLLAPDKYIATSTFPSPTTASTCDSIIIERLDLPIGTTVRIVFGSTPSSTPQNLRVSTITLDSTGGILPVRLLDFNAFNRNTGVELVWQVTNEVEGRSYTIERSTDGSNFEAIKTIPAEGLGSYRFVDNSAKTGNMIYYRLQLTSVDGQRSFSKVNALRLGSNAGLQLLPNPVRNGNLFVTFGPSNGPSTVRVLNVTGQVLQSQQVGAHMEQTSINTSQLAPGPYILQLISGNDIQSRRFVKH